MFGSAPSRASRQRYQSRFGLSRDDRDSTNHGCSSEVWLTTRSITSFIPSAWTLDKQRVEVGQGAEQRIDVAVIADVVTVVGLR